MGKVVPIDCGEGEDCGSLIELGAKLVGVFQGEEGFQYHFAQLGSNEGLFPRGTFQFFLAPEEVWNLEVEPGDTFDVLFIRRDTAGDNVSGQ